MHGDPDKGMLAHHGTVDVVIHFALVSDWH